MDCSMVEVHMIIWMQDFQFKHLCRGVSIAVTCHAWVIGICLHSYSGRSAHSWYGMIGCICILGSCWWLDCGCNGIFRWLLGCLYLLCGFLVFGVKVNVGICYDWLPLYLSLHWNFWEGSCGAWFPLLSASSLYNPAIYMYPIGQPLWFVKINWVGPFQASSLTRAMTVSGIKIVSQLLLVIFLAELRLIHQNPLCLFPLGPRKMAPLVRDTWLLLRSSCLCTWQYFPLFILMCIL